MKRLVYLAPVPLHSPSQRPHHFVWWARERLGCDVWWIEPYPVRLPRWNDVHRLNRKTRCSLGPAWSHDNWLHVLSARYLPLEPLPCGARLMGWVQHALRKELRALLESEDAWLVVGRPSGLAVALCAARQGNRVLYDVMDDMPQFSQGLSRRWMCRTHDALLGQAEVVWGSSGHIVAGLEGRTRRSATLVRNGSVPIPPLTSEALASVGVGTAAHARAPLVLGYVGTIAAWFDWLALRKLALALPDARIHLYGPLEGPRPAALPENVELRGPVAHAAVFDLMRQWHAGLIPFIQNTLTQSVDPVKYYEYRACGLPVLTTLFGEMPHHADTDDGVWPLETLATEGLEERLRSWHRELELLCAQGLPLGPDSLLSATWATRFEAGASVCGWV